MSVTDVLLTNVVNEIVSNYDKVIGKLTLFNNASVKNEKEKETISALERPVTPIEDEIQYSPTTLADFLSLFRRRVSIDKNVSLPEADQLSLLGIIESEIGLIWPQLASLLDYPLFDEEQNKEMRRSLFITVIMKCKECFDVYREKYQFYNDKDIFSDEANLVRVKLQLAEDVKNKLHIPTLRRHMYENVSRGIFVEGPECCQVPSIDKLDNQFQTEIHDNSRRPTRELKKRLPVQSIQGKEERKEDVKEDGKEDGKENGKESFIHSRNGSTSVINEQSEMVDSSFPQSNTNLKSFYEKYQSLKDDLCQLLIHEDEEPDSFPNITTTMESVEYYRKINDQLQKKIEVAMERNKLMTQNETFVPRMSLVNQPSSVARSYKNKVYFVADIRPTPRRSDFDISLSSHGPLWNELADEITPEIVKLLDSNLSRGEEVKDIYKEMMKTVSHEHLSYTQDPLFEKCPPKINIQEVLSSSTLENEVKKERIINPDLKTMSEAPWTSERKSRTDWEQPNYAVVGSTPGDMDLSHFVEVSKNNLSQQKYLSGGSFGGSLASAVNSSQGTRTLPLDNFKDSMTSNRDTPIRIMAKRDYVVSTEKFAKGLTKMPRLMQDRLVKQYDDWMISWKNNFDTSDYMKYLSLQPTDFLSVIFHQFESNADDDESENNELYISPEILEQRHELKQREMERNTLVQQRVQELEHEKLKFSRGLWNPSSIFIGGLGKAPTISDQEMDEILKDKPPMEDPDIRLSKMSAYSRARSAVANSRPLPLFTKPHHDKVALSDQTGNVTDKLSVIQGRLERIWTNLKMPSHLRLDMTIKYSSVTSLSYIDTILHQWELVTNCVLERESALSELEKFERIASDPNRYFVKGYRGSSMARLEESKIRTNLQNLLDNITTVVQHSINDLRITCGDELTYGGRLYVDKIKWDRTEMLYWLQEERKESCTRSIQNRVFIKE